MVSPLLIRRLGNKADSPLFAAFTARLAQRFGAAAAEVRHEIYFTAMTPAGPRPRWCQAVRALAALGRDCCWLWAKAGPRPQRDRPEQSEAEILLVATLSGASGWGCLRRALPSLPAAARVAVVVHPRIAVGATLDGITSRRLPRPRFGDLFRALAVALPLGLRRDRQISAVAVAATVVRHHLWRSAWAGLGPGRRVLLLHNDFDRMSAASLALSGPSVCVQHGVPTDEFFPTRATCQLVWGERSAEVYRRAGTAPGRLIIDALGRGGSRVRPAGVPQGVALISQGHTVMYGQDLGPRLIQLAGELAPLLQDGLKILLHPGEDAQKTPYRQVAGVTISAPPHDLLQPAETSNGAPWLVVGFSSTALLDAAAAGHYVAGLDWPMPGSLGAVTVAAPPLRFAVASAVAACYKDLVNDEQARQGMAQIMLDWQRMNFAGMTGGLQQHLMDLLQS